MSKSQNVNHLLAALQRKNTAATAVEPVRAESATADEARPAGRVGRPVQFWMHDEDRQIIRELSAWLASQGIRPSDSLVIRTALRTAKAGNDLLAAYREASKLDGRFKKAK